MANTQDPNQSLKGLLSDHFFDIAGSTVTHVEQDKNGDYVFTLSVRASSKKPWGGGHHNAKGSDPISPLTVEDFKAILPVADPVSSSNPEPSGGLRKEDIINIAVAAATAAVAAAARAADDGDGKDKKPGGGGHHNAKGPDPLGTE